MKRKNNLFIFGLSVLVGEDERGFYLKDDVRFVIGMLRRKGDDVALVVLGRAPEKMRAMDYLKKRSVNFPTVFVGEDHGAIRAGIRALVRHHRPKRSFCVHYDPAVLAIARRAGAKRIDVRNRSLTDAPQVHSLADIIGYYEEL
ncbi:hypothetical protein M1432_02470 [Patescibacteria group bacterium]|nr:hypothetical protein [Patescibacteria group bacterium]